MSICVNTLDDGIDEDYMPYAKRTHGNARPPPPVVQEYYTAQEVVTDTNTSYSFRSRSERRAKDSLWTKDKDWSPEGDMEYSDASED